MRVDEINFELPEGLIAQKPLADRSGSRLLELDKLTGQVTHRQFVEVVDMLLPGDLLVMNNTKVSGMRLFATKETGAQIEILLLHPTGKPAQFQALIRPSKRVNDGTWLNLENGLRVQILGDSGAGSRFVEFEQSPEWAEKLEEIGLAPLPPYISEPLQDKGRYQTVYASVTGSAAAPTAGLHFTKNILDQLRTKGIDTAEVTLSVGLDTFSPISVETIQEHQMHGETGSIGEETQTKIANCKGRIIAVGTTTVRTLESFAVGKREISTGSKETSIFITPGYEFKIIDGMFTNLHMPKTTMLLMLSALCGVNHLLEAYQEAIQEQYRFLSFGDSMLIW